MVSASELDCIVQLTRWKQFCLNATESRRIDYIIKVFKETNGDIDTDGACLITTAALMQWRARKQAIEGTDVHIFIYALSTHNKRMAR